QNIKNHKKQLLSIHNNAKKEIIKILEKKNLSNEIFLKEFINVFNGVSIKNIPDEFIQKIKDLPYVKNIIPNYKISATLDVSVPLINADELWKMKDSNNVNITGKGVNIAILDTGVDYNHPDLKDNYIEAGSYDFINNDTDPMDDNGHGTHCAGIICGKGYSSNFKYVGVAPDAKYYAIKILDENGNGNFETYLSGMEKALDPNGDGDYSDHADIISLSFGTNTPGRPDDQFCEIVDNVVKEGIVVVVAAGNNGSDFNTITSPGCARLSICVGATDKNDVIASFSSCGPVEWDGNYLVKPDIVAPGVNIISTKKGGGYIAKSGTSMSAPHVAGAAALILQARSDFTPEQVKQVLKEKAKNLGYNQNIQGSGRIDVLNVLKKDTLYIEAPSIINESQWFMVKIKNKNGEPVKALILFTIHFHLTRIRYGSSVIFKAPIIYINDKESLNCKIRIFTKYDKFETIEKEIIVINKKI
ncbi:MAG: S8 family peptidase, partial [Candidatus Thermoplasmatota archaeon]|nr:S8 family peptidase [Candidatus Thermoplasmatota archaeon]